MTTTFDRNSQPVNKEDFWKDRIAEAKRGGKIHYSVYIANQSLWDKILKVHKKIFAKEITKEDSVLDIGCGYGRMSEYFENYLGIDFSPDFIQEAVRMFPTKKFQVADLNKLPFKDKQFDVGIVVSVKGMILGNLGVDVWRPMEEEAKRVCKKVLILEYGMFESMEDNEDTIGRYEIL